MNRSLRVTLIAPFILGTLLLTGLLSWYTYSSAKKAVENAMLLVSETKTEQVSGAMSLLFRSASTSLQNMVTDPHIRDLFVSTGTAPDTDGATRASMDEDGHKTPMDPSHTNARARAAEWLTIMTQGNEYYRDITILDKNGTCIVSSNPGHIGRSYIDKPYVQSALRGIFSTTEFSVGRVTKRFSAVSAGPIDGPSGAINGVLLLVNDFPRIVEYGTHEIGSDSQNIFTALLAPDGNFMAHKDASLMGDVNEDFRKLYLELAAKGVDVGPVTYTLRGKQYVGTAKVEPNTKWVVVTSGLRSEVFASAYNVGIGVLLINFAFVAIITFFVVRFTGGILRSLLSLVDYARRVSEGDLDNSLGASNRQDELGVLHQSLVRLVHSLRSMMMETEEASKMKGQFLANMSHEIRTPLNAIIGMTHLSLRDRGLSLAQKKYVGNIQVAAKSLLGLINDILDLSKVEAGMMELEEIPFSLREMAENILSIHQETARTKGLYLVMEFAQGTPEHFIGDPLRIGQVLNNLLSNALKFTSTGGITLRCELDEEGKELQAIGHAQIKMSLSDTGIGIENKLIPTLFKSFTQADASITRQFGGTGLGLAISDKIVSLLGGGFAVTSEPGKGTTFTFTMILTLDEQTGLGEQKEEVPLDEAFTLLGLQGKRILVAEDNSINQLIMQELLEPCGADIVMADNGKIALDLVMEEHFDLVFMDMQMPVMDGLEATRLIREHMGKGSLPIIAVTANAMKEDREKGFACGMNDYITKPIEPKHLLEILRTWI